MNEFDIILARLAARHIAILEQENDTLRRENADLKAKVGPQAVPTPKEADGNQPS